MYPNLCFLTEVSYKEDESTMGEESQRVLLSQDKCRIQTGSHPALFLSKHYIFQPLPVAEAHQAQWQDTSEHV